MKRIFLPFIFLIYFSSGIALATQTPAANISTTTSSWVNCLSSGDGNVQLALNQIDNCLGTGGATISVKNVTGDFNHNNINTLLFDDTTGFILTNPSPGVAEIALGSGFKTWEVTGQPSLVAVGEDTVQFVAGTGITITTNNSSVPKSITFNSSGGTPGGSSGQIQYNNSGSFGGANVYYVGSNLGVGSTAPGQTLDVQGTLRVNGTNKLMFGNDGLTFIQSQSATGGKLDITAGGQNIGINTIAPVGTLNVTSGGTASLMLRSTSFATDQQIWDISNTASNLNFWPLRNSLSQISAPLTLTQAGNVGIDNSSPGQQLDVTGTVRMTGFNLSTSPTSGYVLTSDSSGNGSWTASSGGGSGNVGIGTVNRIAVYTGITTVGSPANINVDSNGNLGIGSPNPTYSLDVENSTSTSGNLGATGSGIKSVTQYTSTSGGKFPYPNYLKTTITQPDGTSTDTPVLQENEIYINGTSSVTGTGHVVALKGAYFNNNHGAQTKALGIEGAAYNQVSDGTVTDSESVQGALLQNSGIMTRHANFYAYGQSNSGTIGEYVDYFSPSVSGSLNTGGGAVGKYYSLENLDSSKLIYTVGNIGISTTNTLARLSIFNNTNNNTDGLQIINGSSIAANIWQDSSSAMRIDGGNIATHPVIINGLNGVGGNVGIGTVTPGQILDVSGTVRAIQFSGFGTTILASNVGIGTSLAATGMLEISTASDNVPEISLQEVSSNNNTFQFIGNSTSNSGVSAKNLTIAATSGVSDIVLGPSSGAKTAIVIKASGNVGLGTTSPLGGLIVMNGHVGIGSINPQATLDVAGTVNIHGASGVGGIIVQTPYSTTYGVNILSGSGQNSIDSQVTDSVIAGGGGVFANSEACSVAPNTSCHLMVIGGGYDNAIDSGWPSTIAGGAHEKINVATCNTGACGGTGRDIVYTAYVPNANTNHDTISGGSYHAIYNSVYSTIAGGTQNNIGWDGTNTAQSDDSFIGGGRDNSIVGMYNGTVGGFNNTVTLNSSAAAILGGHANTVSASSNGSILGGTGNTVSGDNAVSWGTNSSATASLATAIGSNAVASNNGSVAWADQTGTGITTSTSNQFGMYFSGGYSFTGGRMLIKGTTTTDAPTLGTEFLTNSGWTSTGWTGDWSPDGWTHTSGNTSVLSFPTAATNATRYQITYTVTGRTTGSFTLAFGGYSAASLSATGSVSPTSTTTGNLTITPTSTFDGTIALTIFPITAGTSSLLRLQSSDGTTRMETRVLSAGNDTYWGLNSGNFTTGSSNAGYGSTSLQNLTSGSNNTAIGFAALKNITIPSNNTAFGDNAGALLADGSTLNINSKNSLYLGYQAYPLADGDQNENVVGYQATGNGSNTTTLGNSSITATIIPAGNLGIGSTAPGQAIDVNGSVRASQIIDTALTPTTPAIVNGSGQLASGSYSGNTTKIVTQNGTILAGDCPQYDANGNLTDSGSPCVSGGAVGIGTVNVGSLNNITYYAAGGIRVSGATNVFTNGTGVGIGTANPPDSIDVVTGGVNIGTFTNKTAPSGGLITSGNVGIGTFTTGSLFNVGPTFAVSSGGTATVSAVSGSASASTISIHGGTTNQGGGIVSAGGSASTNGGTLIFTSGTGSGQQPERMRLDATGNVGIGTTVPGQMLDVWGTIRSFNSVYASGQTTAPSIATNDCGSLTPGTVNSNSTDLAGSVATGTSIGNVLSCAVTFGQSHNTAPASCICNDATTPLALAATMTSTKVTCTSLATLASGTISYQCKWNNP